MQPFGTILLLLLSSAALVLLGHVFRLLRWEQFIRIYEYPQRRSLLRAMAGGYAVNFLLPFHVGDFLRAALAGRKMKTGTGFAFATVIMDRFLDVWVVALLFGDVYKRQCPAWPVSRRPIPFTCSTPSPRCRAISLSPGG